MPITHSTMPEPAAASEKPWIQEAYRYEYDRYLASLFLPASIREDIQVLLAWNAEISRIASDVSEPMLGLIRLQWWRETLEKLYAGKVVDGPVILPALWQLITRYCIPERYFTSVLQAREQDFEPEPPGNSAALLHYATECGAGVFRQALSMLEKGEDSALQEAAEHAGRIWAVTGIARAIPTHAAHQKVWIPASWLQEEGINARTVLENEKADIINNLYNGLVALAREQLKVWRESNIIYSQPADVQRLFLPVVIADYYSKRMQRMDWLTAHSRLKTLPLGGMWRLYCAARRCM